MSYFYLIFFILFSLFMIKTPHLL